MAGTESFGLTEAALAAGVTHWAVQQTIRYLATVDGPRSSRIISGAIGCSRALVSNVMKGEAVPLHLVVPAGKQGNHHLFDLAEDGRTLASMITAEIGPFRPVSTPRGGKRTYAPGKPVPPAAPTPPPATNGHAPSSPISALLDGMTLAEIRTFIEGSDVEERRLFRSLILRRVGLAESGGQ